MTTNTDSLMASVDSPLRTTTAPSWAAHVLSNPPHIGLLNDHAHLERKAATNAMNMLTAWPDAEGQREPGITWTKVNAAIAREEIEHFQAVNRIIQSRGGHLTKNHRNPYAKALNDLIRTGQGLHELMDRLMISALIEVRSCERFAALAAYLDSITDTPEYDEELHKLYHGLWASEHGHYLTFLQLARDMPGIDEAEIEQRWQQMLDAEAEILSQQSPGIGMHTGEPD